MTKLAVHALKKVLAYSIAPKLASAFSTPTGAFAAMILRRSPSMFRRHISANLLMIVSLSRLLSASEQTGGGGVGVGFGVENIVGVVIGDGFGVGVGDGVGDGVGLGVGVGVGVGVDVGVGAGVEVSTGVGVGVAISAAIGDAVELGVTVGCGVGDGTGSSVALRVIESPGSAGAAASVNGLVRTASFCFGLR